MPIKKRAEPGNAARKTRSRKAEQITNRISQIEELGQSFTPTLSADGSVGDGPLQGKSAIQRKKLTFGDDSAAISWRVLRIMSEFVDGFDFLSKLRRTVTMFGSARLEEDSPYYQLARELAKRLAEAKYTVVTGGGPGIMEAANRGAGEGQGLSIGLNIELPLEQKFNRYVKQGMGFHYFFSRKFMLDYSALAYVYFPGGYGTLDELFTVLTLIQTGKAEREVPVILIGTAFWKPLCEWMERSLLHQFHTVSPDDVNIWHYTDDLDEAMKIISRASERLEG
jgi:uncharacterized protein (TIGR00730 family)